MDLRYHMFKNLDLYSGKKASPLQTEAIQPACCKDEAVEDTSRCPRRIFLTGYYPASTRNKNIERSNVRMCVNLHRRVSIKLVPRSKAPFPLGRRKRSMSCSGPSVHLYMDR